MASTAAPACQICPWIAAGGRNELDEVAGERRGQRGHRAGANDGELGPAEQERRNAPVSGAKVDIGPARVRHHRPELGQRQRAGRAEEPADDPDQDDPADVRDVAGHARRHQEDPRADHPADHHAEGLDRTEHARQRGRSIAPPDHRRLIAIAPSSRVGGLPAHDVRGPGSSPSGLAAGRCASWRPPEPACSAAVGLVDDRRGLGDRLLSASRPRRACSPRSPGESRAGARHHSPWSGPGRRSACLNQGRPGRPPGRRRPAPRASERIVDPRQRSPETAVAGRQAIERPVQLIGPGLKALDRGDEHRQLSSKPRPPPRDCDPAWPGLSGLARARRASISRSSST